MNNSQASYVTPTPRPSIFQHLAASCYDFLLILGLCFALTTIVIILKINVSSIPMQVGQPTLNTYERHLLQFILALGIYSFYIYFWLQHGRTLGMQTWKLQLVSNNGQRLNFQQANIRFFSAIISWACLGLGIIWPLFDKHRRTWHDISSNTSLVVIASK